MITHTYDETKFKLVPKMATTEMEAAYLSKREEYVFKNLWYAILEKTPEFKEKKKFTIWFGFDNHTFKQIETKDKLRTFVDLRSCFDRDRHGSVFVRTNPGNGNIPELYLSYPIKSGPTEQRPDFNESLLAWVEKLYKLLEENK